MTIDELKEAVRAFYSDTSRSRAETKDALEDLAADVDAFIDSLNDGD